MTPTVPNGFWAGKRVLITGMTGFKGSWLALSLNRLGAKVSGISLPPHTTPSLFEAAAVGQFAESRICDIGNKEPLRAHIDEIQPSIIFHLAAQALVRSAYENPTETFSTNVLGTVNLLDAVRYSRGVRVVVAVTTDKVYRDQQWHWPYRETDPLGGHDPYSASKAATELVVACYRSSFLSSQGVQIASARAGNVIGGGDWSKDRLIPDAIRAWDSQNVLEIRRPEATRPWQHVLEPLSAYMTLAEKLWQGQAEAGSYNFGPDPKDSAKVRDVIELAKRVYGWGEVRYLESNEGPHETCSLMIDASKARRLLNISPRWSLEESISKTLTWYKGFRSGTNALELCNGDIDCFGATSETAFF